MKSRCLLEHDPAYKYYGGRGISVCHEWLDFPTFYKWMLENGYVEKTESRNNEFTLDRINVDGNYRPENCRLVTVETQANNKRDNRYIAYNGETHTASEWAKIKGIKYKNFCNRLYRGWSLDRIMTT